MLYGLSGGVGIKFQKVGQVRRSVLLYIGSCLALCELADIVVTRELQRSLLGIC